MAGPARSAKAFVTSVWTLSFGQSFFFGSGQSATVLQRFHSAASAATPCPSLTISYLPRRAVGAQ
ncbi:hypothetical protein D9M70_599420 [compost metagenome]